MTCAKCGDTEGPFFRNNPKGQVAEWRCELCLDYPPPQDVADLCNVIAEKESST